MDISLRDKFDPEYEVEMDTTQEQIKMQEDAIKQIYNNIIEQVEVLKDCKAVDMDSLINDQRCITPHQRLKLLYIKRKSIIKNYV